MLRSPDAQEVDNSLKTSTLECYPGIVHLGGKPLSVIPEEAFDGLFADQFGD